MDLGRLQAAVGRAAALFAQWQGQQEAFSRLSANAVNLLERMPVRCSALFIDER